MSDETVAMLKRRRSQIKDSLVRLHIFIKEVTAETTSEEINVRIESLEKLHVTFIEVEDKLLNLPNTTTDIKDFEKNYFEIKAKLKTLLKQLNPDPTDALNNTFSKFTEQQRAFVESIHNSTLNHDPTPDIRLPRLNIPQFTGKYSEFPSFKDLFESSVHNTTTISDVHKFQLLKSLLRDDALSLVRHIAVTGPNYKEAYKKLIDRYDKPRHVIHAHIKSFMEQTNIPQCNAKSLRALCDTSDEALRGLKALGDNAETRDPWLIYILLNKLDIETRQSWSEYSVNKFYPSINDFLEFLSKKCDALESCDLSIKRTIRAPIKSLHTTTTNQNCPKCSSNHFLYKCSEFTNMDTSLRRSFVQENNLCYNCLSPNHSVTRCKCKYSCHHCRKRHHTLLHLKQNETTSNACLVQIEEEMNIQSTSQPTTSQTDNINNINDGTIKNYHAHVNKNITSLISQNAHFNQCFVALLPTAIAQVRTITGEFLPCRILLDSGSQASFISEKCMQRLKLPRQNARISVTGLATRGTVTKGCTTLHMTSIYDSEISINVNTLILERLPPSLPYQEINISNWEFVKTLPLADPSFNQPSAIDILIGADRLFNILQDGRVVQPQGSLVAQNTIFGWIITGDLNNLSHTNQSTKSTNNYQLYVNTNIDQHLRKFWEIENIPNKSNFTPEEELCETSFVNTHSREKSGRYIVHFPFAKNTMPLGNSKSTAMCRLYAMERKLNRDTNLRSEYNKFMDEYLKLGHMTLISNDNLVNEHHKHYYLPHHSVIKESSTTTKIRVVFDGSSKSSTGVSINDRLLVGPTIQRDLFSTIVRFRRHLIAFTADIEKMYRQVLISEEERDFQRIVWRNNPNESVQHYRLNTVTYGTASAPFLAIRTLFQLAKDHKHEFPLAAAIIEEDFYVDDLLSGADNEIDATIIADQLQQVLSNGGFKLRKWSSNSPALLKHLPADDIENKSTDLSEETCHIKILGIQWNPTLDTFTYRVNPTNEINVTKRKLLSEAARIFDPAGWISPTTILIKLLFQRLWLVGLQWDDELPEDIAHQWNNIRLDLIHLQKIQIPRRIFLSGKHVQYHCFCDASELAYAAVIYGRDEDDEGNIQVRLIASKTKVSPINQISLPRLELCGALLLVKLFKSIKNTSITSNYRVFAWTDSTIVLSWLSAHPRKWKSFVANRTTEILQEIPRENWHHVKSSNNPADHASRGVSPKEIINLKQWWNGPSWLSEHKNSWPLELSQIQDETLSIIDTKIDLQAASYTYITNDELKNAKRICFKWVQETEFKDELQAIRKGNPLKKGSKLSSLVPYIDTDGILRVGGRLENASCPFDAKHPIILPKGHIISKMIVHLTHVTHLHPGPTLLSNLVRQNYWIIDGRNLARKITRSCIICLKHNAKPTSQIMGNLPASRITPSKPFQRTGVDYAGPIMLLSRRGRGAKVIKGYICIFICFATKAIHLEPVSDLTTDAFIAALRRFIARRGLPSDIYSDNGTNFIGAKRKLNEMYQLFKQNNHNEIISGFLSNQSITWHLIPPASPNIGGLWESGVKSVKHHLIRAAANKNLTFEEMTTLLYQIEAILNSRPLCPMNNEINSLDVLTPGHLLMMSSPSSIAEPNPSNDSFSRLNRWQYIQSCISTFWKRYSIEYLNTLQQRNKNKTVQENLQIGDLVILKEDNLPSCKWAMGRIIKTHPGTDNQVRVVTIKTATSTLQRPVIKVCKIPLG